MTQQNVINEAGEIRFSTTLADDKERDKSAHYTAEYFIKRDSEKFKPSSFVIREGKKEERKQP